MTTNHADQAPAADPETNAPRSSTREQALEAALRSVIAIYDTGRGIESCRTEINACRSALALPPDAAPQNAPVATGDHTPGPWHVCDPIPEQREDDGTSPYIHHEGHVIAVLNDAGQDDMQSRIDARLIAAAPDMLAALHTICQPGNLGDMQGDLMALGRAAIARATGKA